MIVMGLDLSTHAGVAVVNSETKEVLHGEEVCFPKLTGNPRINAIAARVLDVKAEHNPDFILVEDYAVGRFAGSAIVSIELGAVVRYILWQEDFPYLPVSPTSLKKFVTGSGNAKKNTILLEVFKRFDYTAKTDNIADAVALAHYGACLFEALGYTKAQHAVTLLSLKGASDQFLEIHNKLRCS